MLLMNQTFWELPLFHPFYFFEAAPPHSRPLPLPPHPSGHISAWFLKQSGLEKFNFSSQEGTFCTLHNSQGCCKTRSTTWSQLLCYERDTGNIWAAQRSLSPFAERRHTQAHACREGIQRSAFFHFPAQDVNSDIIFPLTQKWGANPLLYHTHPLSEFNYSKSISKETSLPVPLPCSRRHDLARDLREYLCVSQLQAGTDPGCSLLLAVEGPEDSDEQLPLPSSFAPGLSAHPWWEARPPHLLAYSWSRDIEQECARIWLEWE